MNGSQTIDTNEARDLGFIFCAEYGCTNVVPSKEEADRQGWGRESYSYRGRRRRCPGPHLYVWEQDRKPLRWWQFWRYDRP